MTYDKILSYFSERDASSNIMVVSVEADLRTALSTIDKMLENSVEENSIKLDLSGKNKGGNIINMPLDRMNAVELILYNLGKKLANDFGEVIFRADISKRNTKALMKGIIDVDFNRVELLVKKNIEASDKLPISMKSTNNRNYSSKDAEFKMLEDMRSFKFRYVSNKETNLSMLHEASLLCSAMFSERAGMALFIGENKNGDVLNGGVANDKVDSNALLRTLCLENKIPFRHSNVTDLYSLLFDLSAK